MSIIQRNRTAIAVTRTRTWIAPSNAAGVSMGNRVQSRNVIVKHIESDDTYRADLGPLLETSETISSVTSVTPEDSALTAGSSAVISSQTTVPDEYGQDLVIEANTGVSFTLTGGTTGAGCSAITVVFVKSTGKTDAIDLIVEVLGIDV